MRAMLVSVNLETGEIMHEPFDEHFSDKPGGPAHFAWAFWESIKDDWLGWRSTVIADEEARELLGEYRTAVLLGDSHD